MTSLLLPIILIMMINKSSKCSSFFDRRAGARVKNPFQRSILLFEEHWLTGSKIYNEIKTVLCSINYVQIVEIIELLQLK